MHQPHLVGPSVPKTGYDHASQARLRLHRPIRVDTIMCILDGAHAISIRIAIYLPASHSCPHVSNSIDERASTHPCHGLPSQTPWDTEHQLAR